jgi:hypothetical protein
MTQHSANGPDPDSSTRIVPLRQPKAWRAEFVINSDTIMPSFQHRSERIRRGYSTSTSSLLSLFRSLARRHFESCAKLFALAAMGLFFLAN